MVTSGLVGCLALWTLQIATLLSIGCTKRKPQKNEKRRSLNSWRCFVAAKRSILAESYVAQVRDDSENRFQSPGRVRSWPCSTQIDVHSIVGYWVRSGKVASGPKVPGLAPSTGV